MYLAHHEPENVMITGIYYTGPKVASHPRLWEIVVSADTHVHYIHTLSAMQNILCSCKIRVTGVLLLQTNNSFLRYPDR